jgi:hypothetical protein
MPAADRDNEGNRFEAAGYDCVKRHVVDSAVHSAATCCRLCPCQQPSHTGPAAAIASQASKKKRLTIASLA